ncbi:hypothetical protein JYQ62_17320 [Nostoc sp. UHCC 0702]|nr:hypothetical protein JYQ62_17320 [Nostoc sp. UHCC 0702]
MTYLLPLFYSEFIIWYKRSNLKVMTFRLIPTDCDSTGEIVVDEKLKAIVKKAIPEYDEDFEVLLVAVKIAAENLYPYYTPMHCIPSYMDIEITQLRRVYPITERGRRFLKTQIDTNIELAEALFEEDITQVEQERDRKLALAGGRALLKIAGLSEEEFEQELKPLEPDLLLGRYHRLLNDEFPLKDVPFLINLLCYSRKSSIISNTDIGYFSDFGAIIRQSWLEDNQIKNNEIRRNLAAYSEVVKKAIKENPNEDFLNLVDKLFPQLQNLEKITELKCPAISCVIFLKLQRELFQEQILEGTSFASIVEKFKESNYHKELAIGLFILGISFGFDTFCSTYYQYCNLDFLIPKEK